MTIQTTTGAENGVNQGDQAKLSGAQKWDALFQNGAKYRDLNEAFVWQLIEKFKSLSGASLAHVVDLGCGTGDTLLRFAAHGIGVTGIDFSAVALQAAKEKLAASGNRAVFIAADLANLDQVKTTTPTGTLWLCKSVLAFIPDKEKFLQQVRDKMTLGDMLLVMTPVWHDQIVYQPEDKPGIAIRLEEMEQLMSTVFKSPRIFSDEYPGERGHIISYLIKK